MAIDIPRLDDSEWLIAAVAQSPWKSSAIAIGSYIVYKAVDILVIRPWRSPLRNLPGPETNDSIIWGHNRRLLAKDNIPVFTAWFDQYGPVVQFRSFLRKRQVLIKDTKAVTFILNHAYEFQKPSMIRRTLVSLFGEGLLSAEGDVHRRQRKIMNPCFGAAQIRDLMPVFYEKTAKMRGMWLHELEDHSEGQVIDVFPWLTKVTLDMLGEAGFDYRFNSLESEEETEWLQAFKRLLTPTGKLPVFAVLQGIYPVLRIIPTERSRIVLESKATLLTIGRKLVAKKKATLQSGDIKSELANRDLLSILIKANVDGDKASEHLTDEEVMGQICTMLVAGHETTSTSVNWLLWELGKPGNKTVLQKLREEALSVPMDEPSMDELNALTYLDAVVRESMRVNGPADGTSRCAIKDTVIPLSESYTDRNGVKHNELLIGKGENITIALQPINLDKAIWGEDALEFKPERWFNPASHPRAAEIPGVWSSQMSFYGGPRNCIGFRMALMEMKVLVFDIVRHFDFALPDPAPPIFRKPNPIARPTIELPDGTFKAYMPLHLTPLST